MVDPAGASPQGNRLDALKRGRTGLTIRLGRGERDADREQKRSQRGQTDRIRPTIYVRFLQSIKRVAGH
jgi:hypothetical protein